MIAPCDPFEPSSESFPHGYAMTAVFAQSVYRDQVGTDDVSVITIKALGLSIQTMKIINVQFMFLYYRKGLDEAFF